MAAELKLVHPNLTVTLVHSRDKLLSSEPLPDEVKDRSLELLREANVDVLMSHRLDRTEETTDDAGAKCLRVHFTNGHTMLADHVSVAVSKPIPSTSFLPPSVLDEEGYVKIQAKCVAQAFLLHVPLLPLFTPFYPFPFSSLSSPRFPTTIPPLPPLPQNPANSFSPLV